MKLKNLKLWQIISLSLLLFIALSVVKYNYEHTFSTDRWVSHPRERVNIVDDMMSKHNLIGMSKDQVISLLGNETKNAYFKESNNIVYYLGDERGLISIDSEWLVLTFENGTVINADIYTD